MNGVSLNRMICITSFGLFNDKRPITWIKQQSQNVFMLAANVSLHDVSAVNDCSLALSWTQKDFSHIIIICLSVFISPNNLQQLGNVKVFD